MANAGTVAPSLSASRNIFAAKIYDTVATGKSENVVFSPASIHTCLGMAFFGASGATANEMCAGLSLGKCSLDEIEQNFKEFSQQSLKSSSDSGSEGVQMSMANRIYVDERLKLKATFNEIAKRAFNSKAEQVRFADASKTIASINTFVENETNHKIKNLLQPGSVDGQTSVVLINAIYFKGKWKIPFSADTTRKMAFSVGGTRTVSVDTMNMDERVNYGEFRELDAKAIELPYKHSNLSMLLLLPNAENGLEAMEKKLAGKDLNEISSRLQSHQVAIHLPKFRIEYELDLKGPLQQLGMKKMFTQDANFENLVQENEGQMVSQVKHKAFIDVNEAGSEAAAATFMKMVPMSLNLDEKVFKADHPFLFAIRDSNAVYFAGHVVNF